MRNCDIMLSLYSVQADGYSHPAVLPPFASVQTCGLLLRNDLVDPITDTRNALLQRDNLILPAEIVGTSLELFLWDISRPDNQSRQNQTYQVLLGRSQGLFHRILIHRLATSYQHQVSMPPAELTSSTPPPNQCIPASFSASASQAYHLRLYSDYPAFSSMVLPKRPEEADVHTRSLL